MSGATLPSPSTSPSTWPIEGLRTALRRTSGRADSMASAITMGIFAKPWRGLRRYLDRSSEPGVAHDDANLVVAELSVQGFEDRAQKVASDLHYHGLYALIRLRAYPCRH